MSGTPRRPRRPKAQLEPPMIDPHGEATDFIDDVPEMSVEEVEKRIGARDRDRERRAHRRAAAVTGGTRIRTASSRRRVLWRDSATILAGVVLALLAARFLLSSDNGSAVASATPGSSQVAIGSISLATGLQFSAAPTLGGGVVPSGLHLERTPSPPPVITLPPPTPRPTGTPKPTKTPIGQTPAPSKAPTPGPTTTPPAPIADFICAESAPNSLSVIFTNQSTGSITSYSWTFGDGATSTLTNPQHTYPGAGDYTVTLVATGPGGSSTPTNHLCTAG